MHMGVGMDCDVTDHGGEYTKTALAPAHGTVFPFSSTLKGFFLGVSHTPCL